MLEDKMPITDFLSRLTTGVFAPQHEKTPGFAVSLSIKDSKHALSLANSVDMRIPTIELALAHMMNARHYAGENLDSSSLYGTLRAEAGLPFWTAESRQSI
jgi:3-hydroxyisobutyrate dehydrogenase-like beta-hydroxyacid dehydrogenase